MREIKFRAWNKYMGINGIMLVNHNFYSICASGIAHDDELVWMQYTGLKDKNGVEIYEGDIVSDHIGIGSVGYSESVAAYRVVYFDSTARKWFIDYNLRGERESIEVIGNIYENPDLVKS